MIEGMTIAARAVGAREGIIYLRGEYVYLRELAGRRAGGPPCARASRQGYHGVGGFDFDFASRWAPAPISAARRER
jgi:[NiFe] hydrogenase diaphorase moiety large subunit